MSIVLTPDFRIKRGDTLSALIATLKGADGSPVILTGATVTLFMREFTTGALVLTGAATIDGDPTLGRVRYTWVTGDTDEAGYYFAEWQVVFSSGAKQTYPTLGYHLIIIQEDLDTPSLSDETFALVRQLRTMIAETHQGSYSDAMLAAYLERNGFDLQTTAAEVWREKAAAYADLVDISSAGNSRKLSQLYDRAIQQAVAYDAQAGTQTSTAGHVVINDIVR